MIIAEFIYSWPREEKYCLAPHAHRRHGNCIEDYSAELVSVAPRLGDSHTWANHEWKVANTEEYEHPAYEFHRVVLTMDGVPPKITAIQKPFMAILMTASGISMSWFHGRQALPRVGTLNCLHPGWEIVEVYDFEGTLKHHYSCIRVCWCAPVREAAVGQGGSWPR